LLQALAGLKKFYFGFASKILTFATKSLCILIFIGGMPILAVTSGNIHGVYHKILIPDNFLKMDFHRA
jgi:fructose/tagatose bisphosphate aldolase